MPSHIHIYSYHHVTCKLFGISLHHAFNAHSIPYMHMYVCGALPFSHLSYRRLAVCFYFSINAVIGWSKRALALKRNSIYLNLHAIRVRDVLSEICQPCQRRRSASYCIHNLTHLTSLMGVCIYVLQFCYWHTTYFAFFAFVCARKTDCLCAALFPFFYFMFRFYFSSNKLKNFFNLKHAFMLVTEKIVVIIYMHRHTLYFWKLKDATMIYDLHIGTRVYELLLINMFELVWK